MAYQALYRRYRPAKFQDFVGQEAIIKTLKSQVMSGRIAHAYLFCGTRGTGKTSAAKVFARAINCETPEDGEPCGHCAICQSLQEDSTLDVLEIDAASNNGVEEIRDLRDKVKYPPAVGRYRVYIIDEVHMLSQGAFNALLKTLEEPPAHAKFILATTEPQKLPATILSRCQRFDFGRIPLVKIAARLEEAIQTEKIPYEKTAVERIARAAEGGMRDAWSITDMCMGYALENTEGLSDSLVREILGSSDRSTLFDFAEAVIAGDSAAVLAKIDDVMRSGKEIQVFQKDVSSHFRALLMTFVCGKEACAQVLEVTQEDADAYYAQAAKTTQLRLMRIMNLFLQAEADMRWSSQPRFAVENAALRACLPEESLQLEAMRERLDELERKIQSGEIAVSARPAKASKKAAAENESPVSEKAVSMDPGVEPTTEAIYKAMMQEIRKSMPMLYALMVPGRLAHEENGLFTVVFNAKTGGLNVGMLNSRERNEQVATALSVAAGHPCTFKAALEGTVEEKDPRILDAKQDAKRQAQENLQKVFDFFGRENVQINETEE
ncbi:MAG: DNA polymerase III subunit gamma/tau [Clostridia bacterium]|nr:DNA polymerase III subunit gamma/tau [Clostridia bacterium]